MTERAPAYVTQRRRSKYNAVKTMLGGITFDSAHEAERYADLRLLLASGQISDLELQPRFEVIVSGEHICYYRADFRYRENGNTIVEDAKGFRTAVYRLKKKLVEASFGIKIVEV